MKKEILVVDDSSITRHIIKGQLTEAGYKVTEAEDGLSALAIIATHKFDLITLDIDMPGLSGYETGIKILELFESKKKELPDKERVTPLIFVTANDSFMDREEGFRLGACDFVGKQKLSSGELIRSVHRQLNPGRELDGIKLLSVVSDKGLQRALERTLLSQRMVSIHAETSEMALEVLKSTPDICVVIIDEFVDEEDGTLLSREIRTRLGMTEIPILFLTGTNERGHHLSFFKSGATDYLIKPFLSEEFQARIKVHVETFQRNRTLDTLNKELKRSNEALDRYASVVAHDLMAPLSTMMVSIDILKKDLNESGKAVHTLLSNVSARMSKMVTGFLEQAREINQPTTIERELLSIEDVIDNTCENLGMIIAQRGAEIRKVSLFPTIEADSVAIHALFQNLISNAIKFANPGTQPVVTIESISTSYESGLMHAISISDNGIGIEESELQSIFSMYTRANNAYTFQGYGIGLATCQKIVHEHGGKIDVYSKKGVGSKFTISIPSPQNP